MRYRHRQRRWPGQLARPRTAVHSADDLEDGAIITRRSIISFIRWTRAQSWRAGPIHCFTPSLNSYFCIGLDKGDTMHENV